MNKTTEYQTEDDYKWTTMIGTIRGKFPGQKLDSDTKDTDDFN